MTDFIKTKGVLDTISEIEKMNTEYENLPFQEAVMIGTTETLVKWLFNQSREKLFEVKEHKTKGL